jgi:hypothetical protein
MLGFHVWHAKLQHGGPPVRECSRRYPRAAYFLAIEWNPKRERPSPFQVTEGIRQPREPFPALRALAAGGRKLLWNRECHCLYFWAPEL